MEIREKLKRQRVKHIVSSYQLMGEDGESFEHQLEGLLVNYPAPLVELAIAEALAANWLTVPMPKGCAFLAQIQDSLTAWKTHKSAGNCPIEPHIHSSLTPDQFQQITGLDPVPVFGSPKATSHLIS